MQAITKPLMNGKARLEEKQQAGADIQLHECSEATSGGTDSENAVVARELWPELCDRLLWLGEKAEGMIESNSLNALSNEPASAPGKGAGRESIPHEGYPQTTPKGMRRYVLLVETKDESEISFLHISVIDKTPKGRGTLMEFVLTTQDGKIKLLKMPNAQEQVFASGSAIQHRSNRSRILFFFVAQEGIPIEGHIKFRVLSANGTSIESSPVPVGGARNDLPSAPTGSATAATKAKTPSASNTPPPSVPSPPLPVQTKVAEYDESKQHESELHRVGAKRERSSCADDFADDRESMQEHDNELGRLQHSKRARLSKIQDFFQRIDETTKDLLRMGRQLFDSTDIYL
ncbi:Hypothetical Protein FCC1311_080062 [Hondaea fermentalgiana]|uniref:Uncharacterized protein n=1 Tax=Hondaea fermentalgiana TaxID=2315210 RepID=A0A2R5GTR3_9STRA|nr:Hypothetical Protein FCC1311_080062 [Hondaea fermentalgiana]|eukprot:GBG31781.1 Hypothetical Protein FCC1311_080062 [Hondaea fermentalgiana]